MDGIEVLPPPDRLDDDLVAETIQGAAICGEVRRAIEDPANPRDGLTRADIDACRLAGATRDEVRGLAIAVMGEHLGRAIGADLGSYGPWAG